MIDNLFIILGVLITVIFLFFTILNFSNIKFSLKKFIIYFIIMFPFLLILNYFFSGVPRVISAIFLTSISLYFSILNKNMKDSVYYSVVYEMLAFIVEIILSIIFVSVTKLNMENNYPLLMLIFSILVSLVIYIFSKLKFLKRLVERIKGAVSGKQHEIVYILIITILMAAMLVYNGANFKKDLSFYINCGMTFFVFVTLIYMIYKDFQNDKLENNYNEMMDYVQKYEKIINDQGKKNHEYNNQLMVIKGYANNPKKLEEYLNLIINEHKCGQNYTIRELSYFPDGGIKGLIYHKISKMEDNNVKYYIYVDKNIKNIFEEKFDIKTYQDITKLLGVFLDNAIEATLDAKVKEVEIDIKRHDDCIIVVIANTFNNKVDTKQIGKKGFTTKGKGHGYGLSIVKDINKHNDNIETFNDVEDDKFKQTILIYYK